MAAVLAYQRATSGLLIFHHISLFSCIAPVASLGLDCGVSAACCGVIDVLYI